MKCFYYITFFGPGHQSIADDYIFLSTKMVAEFYGIKENEVNEDKFKDYLEQEILRIDPFTSSATTMYWEVESLPKPFVERKQRHAEAEIKRNQEMLETIKKAKIHPVVETEKAPFHERNTPENFQPHAQPLADSLLAISGTTQDTAKLLEIFHKNDCMMTHHQLSGLRRGYLRTTKEWADKIMQVLEKAIKDGEIRSNNALSNQEG